MQKNELHPRNRHRGRYDFRRLIQVCPDLAPFMAPAPHGDETLDFANPAAVKTLNRALLKEYYNVSEWDIPEGYLCPPIPGRADYLHYLADLLSTTQGGKIPRGSAVRVLDIGTGANLVYPLIGRSEYGWSFVGSDVDTTALKSAECILEANPAMKEGIELRQQKSSQRIFEGIIQAEEFFDLALCNPPFHSSLEEAQEGSRRKWRNLGKAQSGKKPPVLNFGGRNSELWCQGGEREFILRMIQESTKFERQCGWFTTLVSKETNLPAVEKAIQKARVAACQLIEMAQGQKKSRFVAWTFLSAADLRR